MLTETQLVAYDDSGERGRTSWLGILPVTAAPTVRGALAFYPRQDAYVVGAFDDRLTLLGEHPVALPEQTYCTRAVSFGQGAALVCSDRTLLFDAAGTVLDTLPHGAPLLDNTIAHGDLIWVVTEGIVGDDTACVGLFGGAPVDCFDVDRAPFERRPNVALASRASAWSMPSCTARFLHVRATRSADRSGR